jgi:ribosomal protein L7Ae-like RNA K-turn-binding protein
MEVVNDYISPYVECRICVIAGNISPIDVITHVPILCEEADIPYVYVTSKEVSLQFFL